MLGMDSQETALRLEGLYVLERGYMNILSFKVFTLLKVKLLLDRLSYTHPSEFYLFLNPFIAT